MSDSPRNRSTVPVAQRTDPDTRIAIYFGCWETPGHYAKHSDGTKLDLPAPTPWGARIDGRLAPHGAPDGVAALHHQDGWTALAFWDHSIDERPGSNSVFFFDEILTFDAAVAAAREHFPQIMERFSFPIVAAATSD